MVNWNYELYTNLRNANLYEYKKNLVIILACFAGFFAYGQMDTARIAVILLDTNEHWSWHVPSKKSYNLNHEQLLTAHDIVNRCIFENGGDEKRSRTLILPIGNHLFFKQFVGSVNENNEVIIWANCFCRLDQGINWKQDIFMVNDGGGDGCYFNVVINLNNRTYSELYVNGF